LAYSDSCDATRLVPSGVDTSQVSRPHLGDLPYGGAGILGCKTPKTIALTYDDGPNVYTEALLDLLDAYQAKATFFISGANSAKGMIDDPQYPWAKVIRRIYDAGHQIASHTWSHQNLDKVSPEQRRNQIVYNEMALNNILGFFPTYMRPPYSDCGQGSGCMDDMDSYGYHVVYFDLDTDDYEQDSPTKIKKSKKIFNNAFSKASANDEPLLVIAHDVHEQTVVSLTPHMLDKLYAAGYRTVTVGECLEDPPENWYRRGDRASITPAPALPDITDPMPANPSRPPIGETTPIEKPKDNGGGKSDADKPVSVTPELGHGNASDKIPPVQAPAPIPAPAAPDEARKLPSSGAPAMKPGFQPGNQSDIGSPSQPQPPVAEAPAGDPTQTTPPAQDRRLPSATPPAGTAPDDNQGDKLARPPLPAEDDEPPFEPIPIPPGIPDGSPIPPDPTAVPQPTNGTEQEVGASPVPASTPANQAGPGQALPTPPIPAVQALGRVHAARPGFKTTHLPIGMNMTRARPSGMAHHATTILTGDVTSDARLLWPRWIMPFLPILRV
ncbi:hypothetical protein KEM52_002129, partial [Ascosphaera acerosa]